jgi:prefoldin beta subunit
MEISKEAQKLINEFQTYKQQLQNLLLQKESLRAQNLEIDRALKELERTNQKTAYKIIGNVMVNKPVEQLKKELNDSKEAIEFKISSLTKTEQRMNEKLKDLQKALEKELS